MNTVPLELQAPSVRAAFLSDCCRLSIEHLVPLKTIRPSAKLSHKYQQIVASVTSVGLVEPLWSRRLRGIQTDTF